MKEMTPQQRGIGMKHLRENWRKYGTIRNPIFAYTTEDTDYIETYSMQTVVLLQRCELQIKPQMHDNTKYLQIEKKTFYEEILPQFSKLEIDCLIINIEDLTTA